MAAVRLANLSKQLREVRIHLCQTSPSSLGVIVIFTQTSFELRLSTKSSKIIKGCKGI